LGALAAALGDTNMKFLHITDLHLVTPGALLKGLDPERRFARCIDDINLHHGDAECCVITGDLADAAEPGAYQLLQDELMRCRIPCHLLIGNHDHRGRFCDYFPHTGVDENGFIQSTIQTSAGVFLFLDSVRAKTHSGEYGEAKQEWLRTQLEKHKDQDLFLFMHHPPFDIHLPCIDRIGLHEQRAFTDIVKPYRQSIRHLFFGHAHRPLCGNWLGISYSSLRGTNHQVGLDFNATEISYVDEAPEYAIVFVDPDRLVIHSNTYPLES
jgi:3',5'-cyclic-AMP phosphodiesterase